MTFIAAVSDCLRIGGDISRDSIKRASSRRNKAMTASHNDTAASQAPNGLYTSTPTQDHSHHTGVNHHWGDQENGLAEAPPSYKTAKTLPAPTLEWKGPTKVAMLPPICPSDGFFYMHDELHIFRHDHLSVRGSKKPRWLPVLMYRSIICDVNTSRARRKLGSTNGAENTMVLSLNAIGPGEIEIPMAMRYDWTTNWDFVLPLRRFSDGGELWMADVCLYFQGLSTSGHDPIPWNDTSRTQRIRGNAIPSRYLAGQCDEEWLKFTWKFCERSQSDCPRWGASFTIYYQEGGEMARGRTEYGFFTALDNPWAFLDPAHITL